MQRLLMGLVIAVVAACGTAKPGGMSGPTMNNKIGDQAAYKSPVVSWEILEREPVANEVQVKHILIGWKDLAEARGGQLDARASERSRKDADDEVASLVKQLQSGADFEALMQAHSEDAASNASSDPMKVTPDSRLVIEFRQLALRLNPGELGVCETQFGYHIVKRL
jgi:parvulin-like peptidyl-prolyl isomerase